MKPVDKSKQLVIAKRGQIVIFSDRRSKYHYAIPMTHLRALIFGPIKYIYANEYEQIPKEKRTNPSL